ncbi:MAG: ATP-binding protein [Thermoflexales bacterium]
MAPAATLSWFTALVFFARPSERSLGRVKDVICGNARRPWPDPLQIRADLEVRRANTEMELAECCAIQGLVARFKSDAINGPAAMPTLTTSAGSGARSGKGLIPAEAARDLTLVLTIEYFRGAVVPFALPFEPGRKLNFLYGENGSGKSTICDAFDFLRSGRV